MLVTYILLVVINIQKNNTMLYIWHIVFHVTCDYGLSYSNLNIKMLSIIQNYMLFFLVKMKSLLFNLQNIKMFEYKLFRNVSVMKQGLDIIMYTTKRYAASSPFIYSLQQKFGTYNQLSNMCQLYNCLCVLARCSIAYKFCESEEIVCITSLFYIHIVDIQCFTFQVFLFKLMYIFQLPYHAVLFMFYLRFLIWV